jgi:hypothetical protein
MNVQRRDFLLSGTVMAAAIAAAPALGQSGLKRPQRLAPEKLAAARRSPAMKPSSIRVAPR